MLIIKKDEEVAIMQQNARLVSSMLGEVASVLKPGMTTMQIDKMCADMIADLKGVPTFLHYGGYPHNCCASVNDVVVHGFPNDVELKDGDIVSIDLGITKDGYVGEHAYSFIIGEVSDEILQLVRVTKESLYMGIAKAINGNRVGDISYAIEEHTQKKYGYGVVRELVGHGLGKTMHEDPYVPNYGRRGTGPKLKENLTIAIEPMINLGTRQVYTDKDGWTIRTADGMPSVHFEHDVCVKKNHPLILSDYSLIEEKEVKNPNLNTSYFKDFKMPVL
ncbi:type I methionyl aminopeptidase [Rhizosphaericola mali]|jgi:methionyl aminopeptidase|uniref:Methionine aminopeptidase n=1 Tax=Rhizosphaericola mali TaxID=2545455 RepID=A0A5P2G778_9BACT|nr:type I methionyl aminopeptidase [Rhizosphaericola mali]QES90558.1 type I methionyl aminopeptidase [Rhizosphaericola mali]